MFGIQRNILIAAVIVLVSVIGGLFTAMMIWKHKAEAAQLATLNAKAEADTTRKAAMSAKDSAKLLGDSLRAVEHLVIQGEIKQDQLDRALNRSTEALVTFTATIAKMVGNTQSTGNVQSSGGATGDSVRTAEFHERKEPYTLDATAKLPRFGRAALSYEISLDTARAELRLGCSAPERGMSVRAATATAITPKWLALDFKRVQQTPEVCANSEIKRRQISLHLGVGAGYGAMLLTDSATRARRLRFGPTVTAGGFISLW